MKILLASPKSGVRGGIARWTGHIIDYYASRDNQNIQLSFFDTAGNVPPPTTNIIRRICRAFGSYPKVLNCLRKSISSDSFDILHFTSSAQWGLIRDLLFLRVAHKKKIKGVVHFRFGRIPQLYEKHNWEWRLLSRVVRKADATIVIDKASYDTLLQAGLNNIYLLPNPLTPKVEDIINKLDLKKRNDKTVLFVGHCYRDKGVYELLYACKQIPGVHLKYVGSISNDIKAELLCLAGEDVDVEIAGEEPYEQIIKDMVVCTVFALPSYTEGFPNVILEAMACECAIVATSVGAIPEMLEEDQYGDYGILVRPQSYDDLKKGLIKILTDNSFSDECRKNVRRRVHERYSMPSVWNQMSEIWKEVMNH